mmetsp:Transcript_61037/g.176775  ORF Transcript_61037/g.176775 Transcript_61037/m.176775 type:complete len:494 (+) Transcript_61037:922-2403(+)
MRSSRHLITCPGFTSLHNLSTTWRQAFSNSGFMRMSEEAATMYNFCKALQGGDSCSKFSCKHSCTRPCMPFLPEHSRATSLAQAFLAFGSRSLCCTRWPTLRRRWSLQTVLFTCTIFSVKQVITCPSALKSLKFALSSSSGQTFPASSAQLLASRRFKWNSLCLRAISFCTTSLHLLSISLLSKLSSKQAHEWPPPSPASLHSVFIVRPQDCMTTELKRTSLAFRACNANSASAHCEEMSPLCLRRQSCTRPPPGWMSLQKVATSDMHMLFTTGAMRMSSTPLRTKRRTSVLQPADFKFSMFVFRHSRTGALPPVSSTSAQSASTSCLHWSWTPNFRRQSWLLASRSSSTSILHFRGNSGFSRLSCKHCMTFASPEGMSRQKVRIAFWQALKISGLKVTSMASTWPWMCMLSLHSGDNLSEFFRRQRRTLVFGMSLQSASTSSLHVRAVSGTASHSVACVCTTRAMAFLQPGFSRSVYCFLRHLRTPPALPSM